MNQINRIKGGLIDRRTTLNFTFDNQLFTGHPGDTLASALLANGQRLVGRSFKYHRPRGIVTAGSEEPNALVQLRRNAHQEPNTRATEAELFNGLEATSQNYRGSLKYDLMAINDLLWPFMAAGFYYKTFMWPKGFWEKVYEPTIRASAGLGKLSLAPDPDTYDKGFLHCDILVVGAGPAGLSAALTSARSGARVILADENFHMGGRLIAETYELDNESGVDWVTETMSELIAFKNFRLLSRTTVYGAFDHGIYGALERRTDHLPANEQKPRQVLWRIYARRTILCAGATERLIAFGNNDRPGVMQAGATRAYVNRWSVVPGKRFAVFTNNNDGWRTATDLTEKGIEVAAIIDTRDRPALASPAGTSVVMGGRIINTRGRHGVHSFSLSNGQTIDADCLAVSGGWNPNIHLTCHQGCRPLWRDDLSTFAPGPNLPSGMTVAGAANGSLRLTQALTEGSKAGALAAEDLGFSASSHRTPKTQDETVEISAFWHVKESQKRCWLDLQNDVTVKDVQLAYQEGFRAVEHMKRYTTLGMATDQGKMASVPALSVLAECSNKSIEDIGTTVFRPPYNPVSIGALAGRSRGKEFRPYRLTPSHAWAIDKAAVFVESGMWLRARWFPQAGEKHWRQTVDREVVQTRRSVGVCDVTTLGKIDIQGKNAAIFLNSVYANGFGKLAVGKVRYGLMLREDGIAMDDGTTARFSETRFVMTTTTANAVSVFRHLEFCRQCLWPKMDVHLLSTTEQYAQYSVAGPNARKLLRKVIDPSFDISNQSFPFMACAEVTVCGGTPARLFRISFSGELAYEIAVPARYGNALIQTLMTAGQEFDAVAYGTEALNVMRIEKGHPAGNELNGQTNGYDLGMGRLLTKPTDYIGRTLSERPGLRSAERPTLVGFRPINRFKDLTAGAHIVAKEADATTKNDEGWISSVAFSPALNHSIGLGFLKRGPERIGEVIRAVNPLKGEDLEAEIVSPHFLDPEGGRLRA